MRKLRCLITGELRQITPEELVRQQLAERLLRMGYSFSDLRANFTIRHGSQAKFVDLAILRQVGPGEDRYQQKHVMLVAETKRRGITPAAFETAKNQAFSYASSCTNCVWVLVFDGNRLDVYRKGYVRDARGERGDWQFVASELPPPEQVSLPLPPATLYREQPAATQRGPLQLTRMGAAPVFHGYSTNQTPSEPPAMSAMGMALREREERAWVVPITERMPVAPQAPKASVWTRLAGAMLVPAMAAVAVVILFVTTMVALHGFIVDRLRR